MEWAAQKQPDLGHLWSGTIVCLSVPNESDLYYWLVGLKDFDPVPFYEPDIGNELSAFAILLTEVEGKVFNHLPLAGSHAIDLPVKGGV